MAWQAVNYDPRIEDRIPESSLGETPSGWVPVDYDPRIADPKPLEVSGSGGILSSFGEGIARGVTTEIPKLIGGAVQFAGSYLPDYLQIVEDTGKALKDWSEEKSTAWFGPEKERSGLEYAVYEGTKMLAPSIVPGAIIGTVLRALRGVGTIVKAAKAAKLSGDVEKATELFTTANKLAKQASEIAYGSTAGLFGLSQAQQTTDTANKRADELEKQGKFEEAKTMRGRAQGIAPLITGIIEGTGEYGGTKYLGKLFRLGEAEIVKRGAKNVVKDFLKTLGVEVGTEIGQQAGEAAVEKVSGIRPEADPITEAIDVIGPVAFMTLLTGGLGATVNAVREQKSEGTPLNIPPSKPEVVKPAEPDPTILQSPTADEAIKQFDKSLEKPAAEIPAQDIRQRLNKLTPEFFTDVRNAVITGQDKEGNAFAIDDAQAMLDEYMKRPSANLASAKQFIGLVTQLRKEADIATKEQAPEVDAFADIRSNIANMEQHIAKNEAYKGTPLYKTWEDALLTEKAKLPVEAGKEIEGASTIRRDEGQVLPGEAAPLEEVAQGQGITGGVTQEDVRQLTEEGGQDLQRGQEVGAGTGGAEQLSPVELEKPAPKEAAPLVEKEMIPAEDTYKWVKDHYYKGAEKVASSRDKKVEPYPYAVGSWRIDKHKGIYGREIEQLQEFNPNKLTLSEEDYTKVNYEGRGEDARRYADWIKEGNTPPPVSVVETDSGDFKVVDGHRRIAAAKIAGTSIQAWVSPRMDTGRKTTDGKPIYAGLTYEGSLYGASKANEMYEQGQRELATTLKSKPVREEAKVIDPAESVTGKQPWEMTRDELGAKYKKAGDVVDGLKVRSEIPNMSSIESSVDNPTILPGLYEIPMSEFDELTGKDYSVSGTKHIADLSSQISTNKEINPLIVVIDKDGPYILEGANRAEALYKNGAKSFPAKVVLDEDSFYEATKQALSEGKPVPPEVLKDYPELSSKKEYVSDLSPQEQIKNLTDAINTIDAQARAHALASNTPYKQDKTSKALGEERERILTAYPELGKAPREAVGGINEFEPLPIDKRIADIYADGKAMRDEVGRDAWNKAKNKMPGPYPGAQVFTKRELDSHLLSVPEFQDKYYDLINIQDNTERAAFDLGFHDYPLKKVTGWRYGEIPESGASTNFREQIVEKGVSLMALDDIPESSGAARLYEAFNAQKKKKNRVGGYFVGYGSDGEPLIIGARKLPRLSNPSRPELAKPEAKPGEPAQGQGLGERPTYSNGLLKPQVGDKVYQTVRGFGGTPAYINGEVYQGPKGTLRVRTTGSSAVVGAAPTGKTYAMNPAWIVEGDPEIKRRQVAKETEKTEQEQSRINAEKAENDRIALSVKSAVESGASPVLAGGGNVKVGDTIFNHRANEDYIVTDIEKDGGVFARPKSEPDFGGGYLGNKPEREWTISKKDYPGLSTQPKKDKTKVEEFAEENHFHVDEALGITLGGKTVNELDRELAISEEPTEVSRVIIDKGQFSSSAVAVSKVLTDKMQSVSVIAAAANLPAEQTRQALSELTNRGVAQWGIGANANAYVKGLATIDYGAEAIPVYGSTNKLFTEDKANKAREILRKKLGGIHMGAPLDPEVIQAGIDLAGYHIEAGARTFTAYAKKMIEDLGDVIRPYLKQFYMAVRYNPGMDTTGMNTPTEMEAIDENTIDISKKETILESKGGTQNATLSNATEETAKVGNDRAGLERPSAGNLPRIEAGEKAPVLSEQSRTTNDAELRPSGEQPSGSSEPSKWADRDGESPGTHDGATQSLGRDAGNMAGVQRSRDYRIGVGELTRVGSWRDTARNNLDAIELVKKLILEKREATPAEKAILVKYTGWGASDLRNNMFPGYKETGGIQVSRLYGEKEPWKDHVERLLSLLTPEEIKAAARSTQYAHYTSEAVVRSIYKAFGRFGFSSGKILEPGMGIGHFLGLLPDSMLRSKYTGIEMDAITAAIAGKLYPGQNIIQGDYTKQILPNNFFDIGIGNPPFSKMKVLTDPDYKKNRFSLHDYFFAKTLDKIRPGGHLVFITSRYTMDKVDDKVRQHLANNADLLGAIRLPQTAFMKNAGTEVVTDVLFLRKRLEGEPAGGVSWQNLKEVATPEGTVNINEYFADHPEMILGKNSLQGSMYKDKEYTVLPMDGNIEDHFDKAVENLPEGTYSIIKNAPKEQTKILAERDFSPLNKKEGGLYINDKSQVMIVDRGSGIALKTLEPKITDKQEKWLKDYIPLRDALKQAQLDQLTDGDWETSLKTLQKIYIAFVEKNGHILDYSVFYRTETDEDGNKSQVEYRKYKNDKLLNMDVEGTLAGLLEDIDEKGEIIKGPFLLSRQIKIAQKPDIKNVYDALAVSLDEIGTFDVNHIAKLSGLPVDEVIGQLGDLVYEEPGREGNILADEYLSGDVVKKLEEAKQAARADDKYKRNITALESVQPQPLTSKDVTVTLGANWIPVEHYSDFMYEVMGIDNYSVTYTDADNRYIVGGIDGRKLQPGRRQGLRGNLSEWGTGDRGANEIYEAVLNNATLRIIRSEKVPGGGTHTFTDPAATAAVNEIAKSMRQRFNTWVWEDAGRAKELLELYNQKFNNLAGRKFDGSHLTLPGTSLKFKLHDHQKRAIWRIIQAGNTYLGHAVGAGKTIEMIAAGMEMKRLGQINKPLYIVPNHMLQQFASEFQELYPLAHVMIADEENFHAKNRQRFVARASLNNPDAIVMTHSSFGLVRMKAENIAPVRNAVMEELRNALNDLSEDKQTNRIRISQMENRIEQAEQRFDSMVAEEGKDNVVTFEEMGVDFLFVDEAHNFRKLDFSTNRQAKGIDSIGSSRAMGLYIKTMWLDHQTPGRSHVFASGTPVTNTMAEIYSIMRFFMEPAMKKEGIGSFDSWANMFGIVSPYTEMNAAGRYEQVERFSEFINVPELMSRVRSFMDVITNSQLGIVVERPEISGGQAEIIITPALEELKDYQRNVLQPRIEASKKWKPSLGEKGNPDPIINIITDGRLASIDLRYVVPGSANNPGSKLNKFIDGIIEKYQTTKDNEYFDDGNNPEHIRGSAVIAFYNHGFGTMVTSKRGFDARAWFMHRLKDEGIPTSEVAWIDDYETAAKKEAMFREVRSGKKRILLGSAKKMGTGLNVQKRLAALEYLDAPWYPADVEQPDGRIVRQGNQNKIVSLRRYATKGSYDATMWQMVARKAKMTEQAFIGDKSVRKITDLSEAGQYAMAAALASGDERAIQLANLKADLERLERLHQAHEQGQLSLRRDKRDNESSIELQQRRIKELKEAEKKVPDYISTISGKVGNKSFDNRAEYGTELIRVYNETVTSSESDGKKIIASMNGLSLAMNRRTFEGSKTPTYSLSLDITDKVSFTIEDNSFISETSPKGLTDRIVNQINGLSSIVSRSEAILKETEENLVKANKRIGAPFTQEQELAEKIAEIARLESELLDEGEDASQITAEMATNLQSEELQIINREPTTADNFYVFTDQGFVEIKGASVVENNQGFDLFAHKEKDGTWTVSERITGLSIIRNQKTKKEVVETALQRLAMSTDRAQETIKSAIDKGKVSPWYQMERQNAPQYAREQQMVSSRPITIADIKSVFPGQRIERQGDNFTVTLKNGVIVRVSNVPVIEENSMALEVGYGKAATVEEGMQIAGSYQRDMNTPEHYGRIELIKSPNGKYNLSHESIHFLEDFGLISRTDGLILSKRIRQEGKWDDKLNKSENLAKWLADELNAPPPKTVAGRIWAAVKSFVDRLSSMLGNRTAAGIVREIKSGEIFEKGAERFNEQTPDIRYSVNNQETGTWVSPVKTKWDSLNYTLADRQIDLRDVQKAIKDFAGAIPSAYDVSLKETLYSGRLSKKIDDYVSHELSRVVQGLADNNIKLEDFEEYLHNRHAQEANEHVRNLPDGMQDGGSGILDTDAEQYLAALSPDKKALYEGLAAQVDYMTQKSRLLLVYYGLESQETIDAWNDMFKHYVPLFREDIENSPGTGMGFNVRGPASKARKGSERRVVDILANIASQRERFLTRGEKNIISTALYGLAKTNPNPDFWKIAKPRVTQMRSVETGEMVEVVDAVTYKGLPNVIMSRQIDPGTGKVVERGVEFNTNNKRAMRMAEALKNFDMDSLGVILGASAKVTRYVSAINTQYNPVFGVTNFFRDTGTAAFNLSTTPIAGKQAQVMKGALRAINGIFSALRGGTTSESAKAFHDFQSQGGQTGYRNLWATSADRGRAIEKEIKRLQSGKTVKFLGGIKKLVSDYNTTGENAIRLSAYQVGIENGMTKEEAAAMAKNLTVNFNKKGQIAGQAGALYAFFNASVQGTMRMAETIKGPAGRRIIIGGILAGVIQAMLLAAAGFDDDEPPEFVKERNIVIPIGGKKYITIPLPLGFNVLPNIGRVATEITMGGFKERGKRMADLIGMITDTFSPIGSSGLSLQTITPTVVDPLAALAENKDWTGKPIFRENFSSLSPQPGPARVKDTATIFGKGLSWAINRMSGGTKYTPGFFSPTPDQIDYLAGQATGGAGRELGKTAEAVESIFTGEELPSYKIPLVGRFYGSSEGQAQEASRFYNNLKKLNIHEAEIKGRRKDRVPISGYLKDNPEARYFNLGNAAERNIRELNERKRSIASRGGRNNSVKVINAQIAARMKQFNDRISEARQ